MQKLIILLLVSAVCSCCQVFGQDSLYTKKEKMHLFYFRLTSGKKGAERYKIWEKYDDFVKTGDFMTAVDYLTGELSMQDVQSGKYAMKTSGRIFLYRGSVYYYLTKYDSALNDLNRAAEIIPKSSYVYFFRGNVKNSLHQFQDASDDYNKAIELKRNHPEFYLARAHNNLTIRSYEYAIEDFTECIKYNFYRASAYYYRALAKSSLEDFDGALADFYQAIDLDPAQTYVYASLSSLYFSNNDIDAAIDIALKGLEQDPQDGYFYHLLGNYYLEKGDFPDADLNFSKCVEIDSVDFQIPLEISIAYFNKNDKSNSLKYLKIAQAREPRLKSGMDGISEIERTLQSCPFPQKNRETLAVMFDEFGQKTDVKDFYEYYALTEEASELYDSNRYSESGHKYSEAFVVLGDKTTKIDRYNAACSWALAGEADSSFVQLFLLANTYHVKGYDFIMDDEDLNSLYKDPRWEEFIAIVRSNKLKAEATCDKHLVAVLDTIYQTDQFYRLKVDTLIVKLGYDSAWKSAEMKALIPIWIMQDSLNLIKIEEILNKYGWVGPEVVGEQGNQTIFLVIQHSDLTVQEKYLPMMREAVKEGKAYAFDLALLEDRVALRQGRKQLYGSQIGYNEKTQNYYVCPLEDPDMVDQKRFEAGLPPLAYYVKEWQLEWNVEQYKKDLEAIEEYEQSNQGK